MADYKDESWLVEKYHEEGLTIAEMADLVDMSERTIRYHMDKHDISRRSPGEQGTEIDKEYLREKYIEQGLSTRKIGDELGYSREVVRRNLKKYNIPIRDNTCGIEDRGFNYRTHPRGHVMVGSNDDSCYVHQLMAIALGADPHSIFGGGNVVHHNNGVAWDNRPTNLTIYDSQRDHMIEGHDRILSESDVIDIRKRANRGELLKDIAEDYPISPQSLGAVASGKTYSDISVR